MEGMALEEQELRMEQAAQLRRLAQSPGWALYRTRLLRLVERSEAEKAGLLRNTRAVEVGEAFRQQGVADGLTSALRELERAIPELEATGGESPAY